jgi:SAM-dependent methyltransferase
MWWRAPVPLRNCSHKTTATTRKNPKTIEGSTMTNRSLHNHHQTSPPLLFVVSIASAAMGVVVGISFQQCLLYYWKSFRHSNVDKADSGSTTIIPIPKSEKQADPERAPEPATALVWSAIGGAMNASQLYIGDRLGLYATMASLCRPKENDEQPTLLSSFTAVQLADETGLNVRWLREWLAQQAAMGVLILLPGVGDDDASLRYRLPHGNASVLSDPSSPYYCIAMIAAVPSLVNRAKTMLPEAFRSGIGRPYDEPEVANAIDRFHTVHIRDVLLPIVLPKAPANHVVQMLQDGCQVGDLGCGGGNLLIAMAKAYPKSTFHGFEISETALTIAAYNVAQAKLTNVHLHDANVDPLGNHTELDLVTTFDVLHDAPDPAALIAQVRRTGAVWILGDIPCQEGIRNNVNNFTNSSMYLAFSTCLCMASSLSTSGGAGLGTLGFSVPVAERMLKAGGFNTVEVLLEHPGARWFYVK